MEFHAADGPQFTYAVSVQSVTLVGLKPHTNYTFHVAGKNAAGRGPFSDDIIILTETRRKLEHQVPFEYFNIIFPQLRLQPLLSQLQ